MANMEKKEYPPKKAPKLPTGTGGKVAKGAKVPGAKTVFKAKRGTK
jgi:hypothetical protein